MKSWFAATGRSAAWLVALALGSSAWAQTVVPPPPASATPAVPPIAELYSKWERMIPMRDGVELFTAIYLPKATNEAHPIVMRRTPYSCSPYGEANFPDSIGPSRRFVEQGYIVVHQDVRGCWKSGGTFDDMRPQMAAQPGALIDESTDTWDSIDWIVKNVPGHNGRVGLWGISYPGFYAAVGSIDAHPALKASSPQAPIADWFFDDFFHHGAFFLPHAFLFLNGFGVPRPGPTSERRPPAVEFKTKDGYQFFLDLGPLRNADRDWFKGRVPYWNVLAAHPNYDAYWQARNLLPHLRKAAPAMLTVGGWFDAEDLYGPLHVYRALEQLNPGIENSLVMGPWSHGGWARGDGDRLGNVRFGGKQSLWYREEVEFPFFERHLRGQPLAAPAEATVFETGRNVWQRFAAWPPKGTRMRALHLLSGGRLAFDAPPTEAVAFDEFVSDPSRPVPFLEDVELGMAKKYMTDDQRFASRRPDVLTWQSEVLAADLTLAGPLLAQLHVSTTGSDADWVVKLVDVHPGDFEYEGADAEAAKADPTQRPMSGYQMLVRSEVIRGRFRDSYTTPAPFVPGEPALVKLPLQDVLHTFRKGHRIMIQVQSTWFPLVDRNPQHYVENIFEAAPADFVPATHRVWRDQNHPSRIDVGVLEGQGVSGS